MHSTLRVILAAAGALLGTSLAAPHSHAAALAPRDFAFGSPIVTAHDAPGYSVAMPLAVYRDTVRDDLGDVRVFNAEGETVPYMLVQPKPPPPTHGAATALPLYPLRANARVVQDGVRLRIESTQGGAVSRTVNQYIVDGRAMQTAVAALQLAWPEGAADFSGRASVEAGDDLGTWTPVVTAGPIANLHANGRPLIENRLTLTPRLAKFWRISWVGPAPSFELSAVLAEPAGDPTDTLHAELAIDGVADPGDADAFTFDLGAHPPVSRVNLALPEANMVSSAELASRRTPRDPWRVVTRGNFYRIKGVGGDEHNAPLTLALDRDRYWRVRFSRGGGTPQTAVRLHAEWVPTEMRFLARGHGPFLLVYGNSALAGAETDLSSLPAAAAFDAATLGEPRVLGGRAQLDPRAAPFPWQPAALWAGLLLTFGVLGWAVVRFTKNGA